MTQDEIICMMKEAGFYIGKDDEFEPAWERFAALVATHEREKLKAPHECQTEGEKTAFSFGWFKAMEQIEAAVLAEREACAKVCLETGIKHPQQTGQEACAAAIRARGEK